MDVRPTQTPNLRLSYRTGTTLHSVRTSDDIKKASSASSSSFLGEDSITTDIAHHFYSPDGKVLALVKRIKSANDPTPAPVPTEPVKLAPSGLPPVTGPPVAETRCIELFDVTYASGTSPVAIGRVPPNADSGILGVEDHVYFSPSSRYLVTWQPMERVSKGEGNLKIWEVKTGRLLLAFEQPSRQSWPVLRWTPNERILLRLNQGQLTAFDWSDFAATIPSRLGTTPLSSSADAPDSDAPVADVSILKKETLREQAITEFSVTHSALAVFVPERKQMPAKVQVYKLNDYSEVVAKLNAKGNRTQLNSSGSGSPNRQQQQQAPVALPVPDPANPLPLIASQDPTASKSFFKADDVQMIWHTRGIGLLVLASTIQDSSGKNYYGETSLYYLQADGKYDCNVTLDKQGPVHAVAWNPKGNGEFAVTYGYMPASTTLFDKRCRPTTHLGSASRNTLVWSPHGRVLCVGGFFALSGEMDFWDTASLTKLGTCRAYCSSSHVFSPDGRYMMASVLWPRMRVDNGIKIFNIFGQLVWSSGNELKELWQATWQPHIVHRDSAPQQRTGSGHFSQPAFTYPKGNAPLDEKDIYPDVNFSKIVVTTPAHEAGVGSSTAGARGSEPTRGGAGAAAGSPAAGGAKAPAKPAGGAYKHPHWSGRSSNAMSHQQSTDGPQKVALQRGPIGGQPAHQPQQQRNLPVGYTPANNSSNQQAQQSRSAMKNKAKRERKKQSKANGEGSSDVGDEQGDDSTAAAE